MSDSYPFITYSGLLEPKHYKQIGSALWLFLWCISSTTKEVEKDGVSWGIVLGNKPVKRDELADKFGVAKRTIATWLKDLEENGYIRTKRTPYGLLIEVNNSKKFKNKKEVIFTSQGDEQKTAHPDEQKTAHSYAENCTSNKDLIKSLIDRLIEGLDDYRLTSERCGALATVLASMPENEIHLDENTVSRRFSEIDRYYLNRKGKLMSAGADYTPMMQLAKMKIPIEFLQFGIDLAFARHDKNKRWPTEEINLFSYCHKVIIGTWNRLSSEIKEAMEPVVESPTESFRPRGINRKADKVADLRRRREEAQRRDQR